MRTYALIEDGIVVNTIVSGIGFVSRQPGQWVKLEDKPFKNASPNFILLGKDTFIPERPYEDFVLDEQKKEWVAPEEKPADKENEFHKWDPDNKEWVKVVRDIKGNSEIEITNEKK
jgi:hypothetical protein